MMKFALALTISVASILPLSACTSPSQVEVASDAVVIDVRTPAEFAAGHLENAVNIPVDSPDFDARIAQLPTDGSYVVYCRSGNRSAQAASRMQNAGFTDVVDAGSVDSASRATGLPVVTN